MTLTYGGMVIVGYCRNCRLAIWGLPGGGTRDEHRYCGVTRA